MKKLLTLVFLVSLTLITQVGFASPPTIKEVYDSQIGVRELTGKNDGPAIKMYNATVGLPEGYSWCAAFVKWCLIKAGYGDNVKNTNAMALSFHKTDRLIKDYNQLRPGDVLTLYYVKLKRIGHTGFFDRRINSRIYRSVEGNTNEAGSREGDGVYVKYRSFRATYSFSRWTT